MECARYAGMLVTALERTRRACASCYLDHRSPVSREGTGQRLASPPRQACSARSEGGASGAGGPARPGEDP
jgi:hypothetical protein